MPDICNALAVLKKNSGYFIEKNVGDGKEGKLQKETVY
jgi:hypothetical protein